MQQIHITLPLPPSVNAMHGYGNKIGSKRAPGVFRSAEYNEWIQYAGIEWRRQFPWGVPVLMQGRLRAQYIFTFIDNRGHDICNREKCLSDFLQEKIFENDSQIDEAHFLRRIERGGKSRVDCWITEIPDTRFVDMLTAGIQS